MTRTPLLRISFLLGLLLAMLGGFFFLRVRSRVPGDGGKGVDCGPVQHLEGSLPVHLLDGGTLRTLRILQVPKFERMRLAFSPDGKDLAVLGQQLLPGKGEGQEVALVLQIWDPATGRLRGERQVDKVLLPAGRTWRSFSLAWSPAGRLALHFRRRVYVVDARGPSLAGALMLFPDPQAGEVESAYVNAMAFSPDGRTLYTCDSQGRLLAWDLERWAGLPATARLQGEHLRVLRADPSGTWLVGASRERLFVWDKSLKPVAVFGDKGVPRPGADQVWNGLEAGDPALAEYRSWDQKTGGALGLALLEEAMSRFEVSTPRRARTGRWLDIQGRTVMLREAASGDVLWARRFVDFWTSDCALSVAGDLIAYPGEPPAEHGDPLGWVTVKSEGGPGRRWLADPRGLIQLAADPHGKRVATVGVLPDIQVWDGERGELLWTLKGHRMCCTGLSMRPDARYLASRGLRERQGVLVWDLETGRLMGRFGGPWEECCDAFLLHPTRPWLRLHDGLWDFEKGQRVARLDLRDPHDPVAFSPDGRLIAIEGAGGVQVMEVQADGALRELRRLPAAGRGEGQMVRLLFSGDGRCLWRLLEVLERRDPDSKGEGTVWDTGTWKAMAWSLRGEGPSLPAGLEEAYPWSAGFKPNRWPPARFRETRMEIDWGVDPDLED